MAGGVEVRAKVVPESDWRTKGFRNFHPTRASERDAAPSGPRTDPQLVGRRSTTGPASAPSLGRSTLAWNALSFAAFQQIEAQVKAGANA
jgi:hypothetical protein